MISFRKILQNLDSYSLFIIWNKMQFFQQLNWRRMLWDKFSFLVLHFVSDFNMTSKLAIFVIGFLLQFMRITSTNSKMFSVVVYITYWLPFVIPRSSCLLSHARLFFLSFYLLFLLIFIGTYTFLRKIQLTVSNYLLNYIYFNVNFS